MPFQGINYIYTHTSMGFPSQVFEKLPSHLLIKVEMDFTSEDDISVLL